MPKSIKVASESDWHEWRGRNIGGSEVSSLFSQWFLPDEGRIATLHAGQPVPETAMYAGQVGYKSPHQLWAEKTGRLKPEDLWDNERVTAGRHLEAGIAAWANEKWPDWRLRKVRRYLMHDKVSGWGASLDYEAHEPGMPPVELKNVDGIIFARSWEVLDGEVIEAPLRFLLQVQAQIGVTGSDHGWLVACVGGNALHRMRVEAHPPSLALIEEAVEAFWLSVRTDKFREDHVQYETLADESRMGLKDKAIDLSEHENLPTLASRYQRWTRHRKRVELHEQYLKGRIASLLGDEATVGMHPKLIVKWPRIHVDEKVIPNYVMAARDYRGALYLSTPKPPKAPKEKA